MDTIICPPNKRTRTWKAKYKLMFAIESKISEIYWFCLCDSYGYDIAKKICKRSEILNLAWERDYALEILASKLVDRFFKSKDPIQLASRYFGKRQQDV